MDIFLCVRERRGFMRALLAADGLQLLSKARQMAAEFRYSYGYDIPVHFLAKKIADENQVPRLAVLLQLPRTLTVSPPSCLMLTRLDPTTNFTSLCLRAGVHAACIQAFARLQHHALWVRLYFSSFSEFSQVHVLVFVAWMTSGARNCSRSTALAIIMDTGYGCNR